MMKVSKHTFLMLGFASLFSACYIGSADAARINCPNVQQAGRFCKSNVSWTALTAIVSNVAAFGLFNLIPSSKDCPEGCYCEGGTKYGIRVNLDVAAKCENRTANSADTYEMSNGGVHLCPSGKWSVKGAKSQSDCYPLTECSTSAAAGKYCLSAQKGIKKCPKGCWCEGGKIAVGEKQPDSDQNLTLTTWCENNKDTGNNYFERHLAQAGVHYCPKGTTSKEGSDSKNDCYAAKDCTSSAARGYYCKEKGTKKECPKGCWCEGTKFAVEAVRANIPLETWCGYVSKYTVDGKDAEFPRWFEEELSVRGVHYCPVEFPNSAKISGKQERCYACIDGDCSNKLYWGKKTCPAGRYLQKNIAADGACTTCEAGYYCPGGEFEVSTIEPQGRYLCEGSAAGASTCANPQPEEPAGEEIEQETNNNVGNHFNGSVADKKISDDMLAGSRDLNNTGTQGTTSNGSYNTNSGTITVEAGKYLPAGSGNPKNCDDPYSFCPGGSFVRNDTKDQGIYKCPLGGYSVPELARNTDLARTMQNYKSCTVSLSKSRLKECWMKTNQTEYKECVFGGTPVDPRD